jgi:hypothetical protein
MRAGRRSRAGAGTAGRARSPDRTRARVAHPMSLRSSCSGSEAHCRKAVTSLAICVRVDGVPSK